MIKRTLHFGNPAYLNTRDGQMVVKREGMADVSIPIEDIGVVVLEHPQITVSHGLLAKLLDNGAAVVTCDQRYHPTGMLLHLEGNSLASARSKAQLAASLPLKKQLWQQTVKAKIDNQAALLNKLGLRSAPLEKWSRDVQSGDTGNCEAKAAAYYWPELLGGEFLRDPDGEPPNHLLNYGYAILRATVARGLVASGLLPVLGIHHKNQYNAYCLADDIMEPFRPYVDQLAFQLYHENEEAGDPTLTTALKKELLKIPTLDIVIDGMGSPLMVGLQRTTASLVACFEGSGRKILYPEL